MNIGAGIFFGALAVVLFIMSFFQFREKGFLFNNAYIWASKKEREEMDKDKKTKSPHYHQSGFVFLLLGISFALYSLYLFLNIYWIFILYIILIIATIIYAILSSIIIKPHK